MGGEQLRGGGARRCAVVGASGARVSRPYGKDIDRHDTVVRINANPTGRWPEASPELSRHLGTKTSIRVLNSINLLGKHEMEPVAQARFLYPWHANEAVNGWQSDGTKIRSNVREASRCRPGPGVVACAHMTDEFVANATSLVSAALQPAATSTVLKPEVTYSGGLLRGLKPSVGFLGVALAIALCDKHPVDMYYFKLCAPEQLGAARICRHPSSQVDTPVFYCKLTFDDRIAQRDGGPGRLNSRYTGPHGLYTKYKEETNVDTKVDPSPGGCLKFEHDFAQEHATYQAMEACGFVTLHA